MAKDKKEILKSVVKKEADKSDEKETQAHEKGESKEFEAGEKEEEAEYDKKDEDDEEEDGKGAAGCLKGYKKMKNKK